MNDPRTDAPHEPLVFCATVSPILVPAVERIVADIREKNPNATDAQVADEMFFRAIVWLDSRIAKKHG